jgi:hypothetical protein
MPGANRRSFSAIVKEIPPALDHFRTELCGKDPLVGKVRLCVMTN